ncbi:hypothetical protein ZOSMA_216G00160 [Zostera marina]|uniref:Uncharacterized protein n=1 Tax=Zostera marina TaxID=29655 RepID=A0A0K9PK47_ZOSMR|nr:hypothetical protein ZOSMA_216G00160 [Zostera marina]
MIAPVVPVKPPPLIPHFWFESRSLPPFLFIPFNSSGSHRSRLSCRAAKRRSLCSLGENNDHEVKHIEDARNLSTDSDPSGKIEEPNTKVHTPNDFKQKLKQYGVAGVLSYGLLNTFYYLTAFIVVWFYVAPTPAGLGYVAAAERFIKIMAMVWAGSQVTKLLRIGGALALAPLVAKGLSWFTTKFKFESTGKAFGFIVGLCITFGISVFLVITLLWA